MKLEKFNDVQKNAILFCKAAYSGARIQQERAENMVIDWTRHNCEKRPKNAKYFIYIKNTNLGTKKYPHIIKSVDYDLIKYYSETENTFYRAGVRINKNNIIGYLC